MSASDVESEGAACAGVGEGPTYRRRTTCSCAGVGDGLAAGVGLVPTHPSAIACVSGRPRADKPCACVLCVGNALLADEGLGPAMYERLSKGYDMPENVRLVDGGVLGLSLLSEFEGQDLVVVVDAVDGTGFPPGTVVRYTDDDVAPSAWPAHAHDATIRDVALAARMIGFAGEIRCLGVQVADAAPDGFSMSLSPEVEAALSSVAEEVVSLLEAYGIEGMSPKVGVAE